MSRGVSPQWFCDPTLRFPPLAPAGGSSPASQVLPERSDFPPSIPPRSLSFARAVPRTAARREAAGSCCLPAPRRNSRRCLNPLPSTPLVETTGSPRFLGNPSANMLCSSTPADRIRQAIATHPMLPSARLTASAPRSVTFRGSITRPARSLSTLRGSDYSDRQRARLASQWRPALLGQDSHLLGCIRRFPLCASTHIVFPPRSFSWRTNRRDAVRLALNEGLQPGFSPGFYGALSATGKS